MPCAGGLGYNYKSQPSLCPLAPIAIPQPTATGFQTGMHSKANRTLIENLKIYCTVLTVSPSLLHDEIACAEKGQLLN